MRTVKLIIEYDGTRYCGWQIQQNGISIQETLRNAIHKLTGENVSLIGSSRTDAGVHALGQAAHFRTKTQVPPEGIQKGLNSLLASDIRILEARNMPSDFHSLRDAKGKHYRYIIDTGKIVSALYHDRSWYVHQHLDLKSMQEASKMLVGKHDFSSFKASGSNVKDAVRTIHAIRVKRIRRTMKGIPCPVNGFSVDVLGDGFVRHMVRNIIGWLVETGRGHISLEEARRIFECRKRTEAGVCAPASGLYLMEVFY